MDIMININSFFTLDGKPSGPIDKNKCIFGALALAGIIMIVAASILGLGIPLIVVGVATSIKFAALIMGGVGLALTTSMIYKLYHEKVVVNLEEEPVRDQIISLPNQLFTYDNILKT